MVPCGYDSLQLIAKNNHLTNFLSSSPNLYLHISIPIIINRSSDPAITEFIDDTVKPKNIEINKSKKYKNYKTISIPMEIILTSTLDPTTPVEYTLSIMKLKIFSQNIEQIYENSDHK